MAKLNLKTMLEEIKDIELYKVDESISLVVSKYPQICKCLMLRINKKMRSVSKLYTLDLQYFLDELQYNKFELIKSEKSNIYEIADRIVGEF